VANQNVNNAEAIIVIICQKFRCSIFEMFSNHLIIYFHPK
jgi:hypothetical protein